MAISRQPSVTYNGNTYKVRGKVEIPELANMERFAALQWICRHTYARGYSKPNPLAGLGSAISVKAG